MPVFPPSLRRQIVGDLGAGIGERGIVRGRRVGYGLDVACRMLRPTAEFEHETRAASQCRLPMAFIARGHWSAPGPRGHSPGRGRRPRVEHLPCDVPLQSTFEPSVLNKLSCLLGNRVSIGRARVVAVTRLAHHRRPATGCCRRECRDPRFSRRGARQGIAAGAVAAFRGMARGSGRPRAAPLSRDAAHDVS